MFVAYRLTSLWIRFLKRGSWYRFDNTAVDPDRGPVCSRCQRTAQVNHQAGYLLWQDEPLDNRTRAHCFKKFLYYLVLTHSARLYHLANKRLYSLTPRRTDQHAVDRNLRAGSRLGDAASNRDLRGLGDSVVNHLPRNPHTRFA